MESNLANTFASLDLVLRYSSGNVFTNFSTLPLIGISCRVHIISFVSLQYMLSRFFKCLNAPTALIPVIISNGALFDQNQIQGIVVKASKL